MSGARVAAAELELRAARARLDHTVGELQERLNPHTIAQDAWDSARERGADLAEGVAQAARERPVVAGAVAAGLAAFLLRNRIIGTVGRLFRSNKPDDGDTPRRRGKSH